MMSELQGHITDEQIAEIIKTIMRRYKCYRRFTDNPEFDGLFAKEYTPHKKQHNLSWAISSAFPSNTTIADNLQIFCLQYGRGHARPLLKNNSIEMHILSTTSDFTAKYLDEFYQKNGNHFSNQTLYCYIKFQVEKNQLVMLSLCLPNENGDIVHEKVLLDNSAIERMMAQEE